MTEQEIWVVAVALGFTGIIWPRMAFFALLVAGGLELLSAL